jgi:hypothetical protein
MSLNLTIERVHFASELGHKMNQQFEYLNGFGKIGTMIWQNWHDDLAKLP